MTDKPASGQCKAGRYDRILTGATTGFVDHDRDQDRSVLEITQVKMRLMMANMLQSTSACAMQQLAKSLPAPIAMIGQASTEGIKYDCQNLVYKEPCHMRLRRLLVTPLSPASPTIRAQSQNWPETKCLQLVRLMYRRVTRSSQLINFVCTDVVDSAVLPV